MPYATPVQFVSKFGLAETVQLLADEEQLLTTQLFLDAMAGTWTGTPSEEEQAAATAALARLTDQLAVSGSEMDGYLRAAVVLPLSADDANTGVLRDCCLALGRCGIADDCDNSTTQIQDACKTWRSWLRDVAAKRVLLVMASGDAAPSSGGARGGQAKSNFHWRAFGRIQ